MCGIALNKQLGQLLWRQLLSGFKPVGCHIPVQCIRERLHLDAFCDLTEPDGADHEPASTNPRLKKDAQLMIPFKVVDHLYHRADVGCGMLQHGAVCVGYQVIPLGGSAGARAKSDRAGCA